MLCWQRSEADTGQRLIEPREQQNRGYLGYHPVRENATTAIYEPMLNSSRRSLPKKRRKERKSRKNSPPPRGRRDNSG
jgi:hypothetical protein